jgi:hypothetical protein
MQCSFYKRGSNNSYLLLVILTEGKKCFCSIFNIFFICWCVISSSFGWELLTHKQWYDESCWNKRYWWLQKFKKRKKERLQIRKRNVKQSNPWREENNKQFNFNLIWKMTETYVNVMHWYCLSGNLKLLGHFEKRILKTLTVPLAIHKVSKDEV